MHNLHFPYRLYLVTDEDACLGRDLLKITEAAVKGGVDLVQLREKHLDHEPFLQKALRFKDMLSKYNVPLIINDTVWVAEHCQAEGLHVGNSDIPPAHIHQTWPACKIIGYSIEHEKQLHYPDAAVADYLALSPVFATPTKQNTVTPWQLEGVRTIRQKTAKPLVAIGAINEKNALSVLQAGADCLAVVSAICSASDPRGAAERIRIQIENTLKSL